ncbi:hypothetical protein RR48_07591 [Papilio machaon]|uniref:Uncharacterized protein n=1 Tax=Papilio machaon TaxID=76193 RepID=A0A194QQE0_PAPMA|nr:hypothetical protein RR48_07591 [Papilio machaon]
MTRTITGEVIKDHVRPTRKTIPLRWILIRSIPEIDHQSEENVPPKKTITNPPQTSPSIQSTYTNPDFVERKTPYSEDDIAPFLVHVRRYSSLYQPPMDALLSPNPPQQEYLLELLLSILINIISKMNDVALPNNV